MDDNDKGIQDIASQGRILIVDDSQQGTQILTILLEDEGYTPLVAHTGPEALEVIYHEPPDVVILDVMMPGMTGMEVLQAIRRNPASADLPVIMVTALGETHDVVQGLELGANDYLTKPPQFEILLARVRTQLKLKYLQDQRKRDIASLKALDSLKDKFIQIAAHDLKNPLGNIFMGLEILERNAQNYTGKELETYRQIISLMTAAARTMEVIISDFLDLEAMRQGKITLSKKSIVLNSIVQQVVDQFRVGAQAKSIEIVTELEDAIPALQADENRLLQVISNLVSNAVKFSKEGTTVNVRTYSTRNMVRCEVEDNGPGIPEDELPLLFQEFARLSNRPTGGEKSSGVGLAIARNLVEQHGGRIGAHSERGVGSIFWFEIPLGG